MMLGYQHFIWVICLYFFQKRKREKPDWLKFPSVLQESQDIRLSIAQNKVQNLKWFWS